MSLKEIKERMQAVEGASQYQAQPLSLKEITDIAQTVKDMAREGALNAMHLRSNLEFYILHNPVSDDVRDALQSLQNAEREAKDFFGFMELALLPLRKVLK